MGASRLSVAASHLPAAVKRVRCDRAVTSRRVSSVKLRHVTSVVTSRQSYDDVPFYISQQDQDSAVHEARARVQMIREGRGAVRLLLTSDGRRSSVCGSTTEDARKVSVA